MTTSHHIINKVSREVMEETIGFDYQIEFLVMHNELNGRENVVFSVRGFMVSYDKNANDKSYKKFFVTEIPVTDLTEFTDYKNLTKEQVIGWINKYMSESHRLNLMHELYEEHYPTIRYVRPKF